MIRLLDLLLHLFSRILRSRCDLLLENLALRQQVGVLRRNCPRPRLTGPDKFFWVVLRRLWPGWKRALTLVQPETAVRQQVGVLRRNCPRPRLTGPDKFFWVVLRRLWPGWKRALTLVQPETVVR